jgi:antitoxin YefM
MTSTIFCGFRSSDLADLLTVCSSNVIIVIILVIEVNMKTLPLYEVKANLSKLVEKVDSTDEEIVITRNGRPSAVIVSMDEFESWKETLAIKASAGLMAEIKKGLKGIKKAKVYTLDELLKGIG